MESGGRDRGLRLADRIGAIRELVLGARGFQARSPWGNGKGVLTKGMLDRTRDPPGEVEEAVCFFFFEADTTGENVGGSEGVGDECLSFG